MMLLIDSGNTRIKWAIVQGIDWLCSGILPVERAGELSQHLVEHCDEFSKGMHDIEQVWVSNVAGEEIGLHINNFSADRNVKPHFIVASEEQCGVRNGYSRPEHLGSDRWAALVGAWHLMNGECLVVNCGTATTIDALSGQGEFMGGLILPGADLMLSSLCDATAQLMTSRDEKLLIEPLASPPSRQKATAKRLVMSGHPGEYVSFPKNTADAMFSGVIQASCGAIQRQHALLDNDSAPVVLSGGAAEVLQGHLRQVADKTTDTTTSLSTKPPKNGSPVAGYGEASRLHPQGVRQGVPGSFATTLPQREEVQCGHSRTRGLRSTVSWPHLHMPLRIVDNLVLQGLLIIAQEASEE
jgi:type III pantothenate kinase